MENRVQASRVSRGSVRRGVASRGGTGLKLEGGKAGGLRGGKAGSGLNK